MSSLAQRLRERAESYRQSGPSAEHTAALLEEAAEVIEYRAERPYVPPVADRATPKGVARLVEVSRAFHADPNDNDRRLTFMKATFNLDRCAALIVALADEAASPTEQQPQIPG